MYLISIIYCIEVSTLILSLDETKCSQSIKGKIKNFLDLLSAILDEGHINLMNNILLHLCAAQLLVTLGSSLMIKMLKTRKQPKTKKKQRKQR